MPFADIEVSRDRGQPVELYLIRYGDNVNSYIAYTNAEQPIAFAGIEYVPEVINRASTIRSSGSLDRQELQLRITTASRLAELFKIYPPTLPVTLIIYAGHANDPAIDFKAIWSGRILTCQRENSEAVFRCESIITSMKRTGLRRHYQYRCSHVLYGQGEGMCNANKEAARIRRPVISMNAAKTLIRFSDFWNVHPLESYYQGTVEWDSSIGREYRTILNVSIDNVLTMSGPLYEIQPGNEIDIFLGCNHHLGTHDTFGDCKNRHNNQQNYGGQNWIPLENPIGKSNAYY